MVRRFDAQPSLWGLKSLAAPLIWRRSTQNGECSRRGRPTENTVTTQGPCSSLEDRSSRKTGYKGALKPLILTASLPVLRPPFFRSGKVTLPFPPRSGKSSHLNLRTPFGARSRDNPLITPCSRLDSVASSAPAQLGAMKSNHSWFLGSPHLVYQQPSRPAHGFLDETKNSTNGSDKGGCRGFADPSNSPARANRAELRDLPKVTTGQHECMVPVSQGYSSEGKSREAGTR